jgi:ubiquitin-protein ligase
LAFKNFPLIRVTKAAGNPPNLYEIEYLVRSLERGKGEKPVPRELHRVEISLTADYPRLPPHCRMLTPIFHPNIDPTTICVGDHWAAGERLADLVVRIGELLAYQAYNIKSPLDAEAAMWADLHPSELPTDSRNLHPAEL